MSFFEVALLMLGTGQYAYCDLGDVSMGIISSNCHAVSLFCKISQSPQLSAVQHCIFSF